MATVTKHTWTSSGQEKTAWVLLHAGQNKNGGWRRADAYRLRVEGEVKQGIHTPESQSVTVSQATQLWLDTRELNRREQSALRQYRDHVQLHIEPPIGSLKLAHLSPSRVDAFRDDLLRKVGVAGDGAEGKGADKPQRDHPRSGS